MSCCLSCVFLALQTDPALAAARATLDGWARWGSGSLAEPANVAAARATIAMYDMTRGARAADVHPTPTPTPTTADAGGVRNGAASAASALGLGTSSTNVASSSASPPVAVTQAAPFPATTAAAAASPDLVDVPTHPNRQPTEERPGTHSIHGLWAVANRRTTGVDCPNPNILSARLHLVGGSIVGCENVLR